jgi:hypothetical protein
METFTPEGFVGLQDMKEGDELFPQKLKYEKGRVQYYVEH